MRRAEKEYLKIIDWLDSLNENKIVPGLDRMNELMNLFGNPQNNLNLIIVGGTNAKGSTCFNIEDNFSKNGIDVGCFTSPHIHSVRERIRIGKEKINIEDFTNTMQKIREIVTVNEIEATYFEILTVLAYVYFSSKKLDYAVMEIGLGGEWDAVNIGNAKIAILTTLGLDHMDYLGDNLDSIANTKAKIIRENSIAITGWPKEYQKHIPKCKEIHHGNSIQKWTELVMKALKLDYFNGEISVPGRYEKADSFLLDCAHNPQAINHLLSKNNTYNKIIIGMMSDKDCKSILELLPQENEILLCKLKTPRAAETKYLAEICNEIGKNCIEFRSVREAMDYAKNEQTLITGSFYTVAEARTHLNLEGYSEL